jgi:hypothetical protein
MLVQRQLVQQHVERSPLLNGSFTPSEAQEILNSVVCQYRNIYNLQYMKYWEGNHNFDSSEIDAKIESLNFLQKELNAKIRDARETGSRVDVEGLLKLRIA